MCAETLNIVRLLIILKLINRFNSIPCKILVGSTSQNNLTAENIVGVFILANFKSNYKAIVIEAVVTGIRKEKPIGLKEYDREARNRPIPT